MSWKSFVTINYGHLETFRLWDTIYRAFGMLLSKAVGAARPKGCTAGRPRWSKTLVQQLTAMPPLPEIDAPVALTLNLSDICNLSPTQARLHVAAMLYPALLEIARNHKTGTIIDRALFAKAIGVEPTQMKRIERRAGLGGSSPHSRCRKRK